MSKLTTIFTCSNCDAQFQKWTGRCLECGKWGTIEEGTQQKNGSQKEISHTTLKIEKIQQVVSSSESRTKTNISELDSVLGGGLVSGSFILLGGEPGIGKSTLALQLSCSIKDTLYISGEESVGQISMRYKRILIPGKQSTAPNILNATNVESIIATIRKEGPPLTIIDSIQTLYSDDVDGGAGAPNQLRATAVKLMECAKSTNSVIVIIGHVTKDGSVAGPKTLEHLVDTVLYLEGDRHHNLRILRSVKNRFGSTDEIGMFDMKETGLVEVKNPSELLLSERGESMPGSVVTCLIEGTRPVLVEIQALVNKTSFGYPVRKSSGFDLNRLHVLIAVLQRRAGLNLAQYDVHINVAGGVKANEPATDLAICMAIASAYKDKALGLDLAVFGEVGLGGEVRSVRFNEKRIKECEQLGMKRIITNNKKTNSSRIRSDKMSEANFVKNKNNINVIGVKNIKELILQT